MSDKKVNSELYRIDLINRDLVQLSTIESCDMTDDEKQTMIDNLLESISGDLEMVTTRGVSLMSELTERIDYIKQRELELASKRAKVERLQAKLKERLTQFVKLNGGRVETELVTLWIKKSEYVEVIDKNLVPKELMYFPPIPEAQPDKVEIKKILKNGRTVDGCRLGERDNLQIK